MTTDAPDGRRSLVQVTSDPLNPTALLARVQDHGHGAAVLFIGTVRDYARESSPGEADEGGAAGQAEPSDAPRDRPVSGMTYEAYEPMAKSVLKQIATEVVARVGAVRFAIAHRVGALELGEVSVAIAISTPHRAEAYEASRYIIEEIKKRVPVWKHEHYTDGESAWVEGVPLVAESPGATVPLGSEPASPEDPDITPSGITPPASDR